jgi:hypothetical protein
VRRRARPPATTLCLEPLKAVVAPTSGSWTAMLVLATVARRTWDRGLAMWTSLSRAPVRLWSHYVVESMNVLHLEGMIGGHDLVGREGVMDTYLPCVLIDLMMLSLRITFEPYLGVWPMLADR